MSIFIEKESIEISDNIREEDDEENDLDHYENDGFIVMDSEEDEENDLDYLDDDDEDIDELEEAFQEIDRLKRIIRKLKKENLLISKLRGHRGLKTIIDSDEEEEEMKKLTVKKKKRVNLTESESNKVNTLLNGDTIQKITKDLLEKARRGQKWEYENNLKYGPNIHSACVDLMISYLNEWRKDASFKPKPSRDSFDFIEKLAVAGYEESIPFHMELKRASELFRASRGLVDVGYSNLSPTLGLYEDFLRLKESNKIKRKSRKRSWSDSRPNGG